MLTYNAIITELKNIPVNRLEDLYKMVRSLNPNSRKSAQIKKKILSFSGAFGDMPPKDYSDFVDETKKSRAGLFDRKFE